MSLLAFVLTLLSTAAFRAGAANARGRTAPWRHGTAAGWACALAGLAAWVAALGAGAGLCVMLGTWSLGAIALPWLALRSAPAAAVKR